MKKRRLNDALHREAGRRFGLFNVLFDKQQAVIDHPSRKKCVVTPRRGGKTWLAAVWLFMWALTKKPPPGQPPLKYLYIALTRPSAKDIAWAILKALDSTFNLGCHFVDSLLEVRCPNGAVIMLRGADQDNWMSRLEGQAFKLIIVDEAALYANVNVANLVQFSLGPMTMDYDGTICLIGRPGPVCHGFFWDITRPEEEKRKPAGWKFFNWSGLDNPHMAAQIEKEIAELKRDAPGIEHTPQFLQNYMGLWVPDAEGNVYRFNEDINLTPEGWFYEAKPEDRYVGGLDFGWDDSTAVGVAFWNPSSPVLTYLESKKQKEWLLSEVMEHIDGLLEKYPGLQIYGDPARKQLFMEMQTRFKHCIHVAQKEEKRDHIEIWNTTAMSGHVLIHKKTNEDYVDELTSLKKYWPPSSKKHEWIEHPRQANDLCDQGLYLFRHAYAFMHKPDPVKIAPGSAEALRLEEQKILEAELDRFKQAKKTKWWAA